MQKMQCGFFFLNIDQPVHYHQFVLVIWFSAEMCLWAEKEKTQINLEWICMVITLWKLYFCNSLRIIISTDTGQRYVLFFWYCAQMHSGLWRAINQLYHQLPDCIVPLATITQSKEKVDFNIMKLIINFLP